MEKPAEIPKLVDFEVIWFFANLDKVSYLLIKPADDSVGSPVQALIDFWSFLFILNAPLDFNQMKFD
ncbi:hypothetical protein [Larkinella terrae]|uniref:Uncharacterized protein n=1 Tax=Larkinella terrae TaxID=2025311 RepID=A0A7K0EK66_9BACT|nr:hypothetical protein [Larkinella terrae]MRS61866.1 hypothetical protein [Larkinella terrae]